MPLPNSFILAGLAVCLASSLPVDAATLLDHWPLDEGSGGTVADSVGSADMTIQGATTGWTSGKDGGAFEFTGSNYARSATDAVAIPSSGSAALAFWFRTGAGVGRRDVLVDIEDRYTVRMNGEQLQVTFSDDMGSSPRFGADLADGLWHHVVAQNNGTTTTVYIDGGLAGTRTEALGSLTSTSQRTTIAARRNGNNRFEGALDDVRLYDGLLTVSEIQALAQVADQPPVAQNDAYSGAVNSQLVVTAPGVLANDSDVDGDTLNASLVTDVSQGTLSLSADGSFTYDPPNGFVGVISFTYRAVDVDGSSNLATVELTILDPASSLTAEEVAQIEGDLGITLSSQEILDLSSLVKPQSLPAWRRDANLRIETHRKADLTVQVVDSQGTPVPSADVRMELQKHDFKFSGVVTVMDLTDASGNLSNGGSTIADWERLTKALFNSVGLNNGFKPKITGQHQYIPNFMSWAASNDLDVRGHLLMWPGGGDVETLDTPGAISGDDYGNHLSNASSSDYASYNVLGAVDTYKASARTQADKDALESVIDAEVLEWVSQWDVYEWDVINETISNQLLMEILGFDQMAEWFEIAEANKVSPDAKLFINDFQITSAKFTGTAYTSRRDTYFSRIDQIIGDSAPLDGIGFQSRFKFLDGYDPATVYSRLDEFAVRYPDLEFSGTEFEVKDNYNFFTGELVEAYDEITRARVTEEVLTTYFSHDQVTGFSAWDFINRQPDGTDSAYSRSLAYYGDGSGGPIVKLNALVWYYLHRIRYHNDVSDTTSASGEVSLRGFKGEQRVTVSYDGNDYVVPVTLLADGSRQVSLDDVTLVAAPTQKTIERWDFDDAADTDLPLVINSAGIAAFTEAFESTATDGLGNVVVGQSALVTEQFNGDFAVAEPLTNGAKSKGIYELEFVLSELDYTSGDPNGASVGFGLKDSTADEELFVVRLNKNVGGLAVSSYIDTTYTQIQYFADQFSLSEPLKIRAVIDLDAGVADVYTTLGAGVEAFQQQVNLSTVATTWDQVLFAIQNNQADWGATDFAKIDYVQIRKLDVDNYDLWAARTSWGGETLQGPLDDPDGDEIVNLLEYALSANPVVDDAASKYPRLIEVEGQPYLRFQLGADSVDLRYRLEHSVDLKDWSTLSPTPVHGEAGDFVELPLLNGSFPKRFSRLAAQQD